MRQCLTWLLLYSVAAVGFSSAQVNERRVVGTGLLGSTEAELAKRLGPPDLATTNYQSQSYKPVPPVVKVVYFPWKKIKNDDKTKRDALIAVGFDAKGIARTIQAEDGSMYSQPGMGAFCSAIAEGPWQVDKDASALFASSGSQSLLFDEYTQSLWRSTNIGVKILQGKVGFAKVTGVQTEAKGKAVSRSKDGSVYAICNLFFDSRYTTQVKCVGLELIDAESFWARVFDELLTLWKEGPPSGSSIKSPPPDKFAPSPWDPNDHYRVTAQRLSHAVIALVRNPGADLKLTRVPTDILRDWPDPVLTKKLVEVLQKDPAAVRARAALMLGDMADPGIVQPLIDALKGKPPEPAAARALQAIAGIDLGPDPAAWQQWWKENRKTLEQRFDARMQEACSSLRVRVADKHYHLPRCPTLAQAASYPATILDARKSRTPCTKCKPPK